MIDTNPFAGFVPALTTPFDEKGAVDHAQLARQAEQLVRAGARGVIPLGSLGEGATLEPPEKSAIVATLVQAVGHAVPVIPAVAAPSTAQAVAFAHEAHRLGARGLMVLPPYVYSGSTREMAVHVATVLDATPLPGMLYNNPIAYHTDFLPDGIAALARSHPNLCAVKESTGDVRRIHALRTLLGESL
ncbi:dihydrodipicolinate synthase, partial [mine drainage metagenome]